MLKRIFLGLCLLMFSNYSVGKVYTEEGLEYLLFQEIPDVIVASKKSEKITEAPSVVSVITRAEILSYGANNLRDIFDRSPSMQVLGTQMQPESSVSLRAQSFFQLNNHVLFLINGRPFREHLIQGYVATIMGGFPVDMIERIEIIRGPGSVLYGSAAFSGVVNIITRAGENVSGFQLDVTYGSFETTNTDVVLSKSGEDWDLLLAGRYWDSEGWDMEFTDQRRVYWDFPINEYDGGLFLDARYKELRFNGFFAEIYQDAFQPPGFGPLRKHKNRHTFFNLGYEFELTDNWKIETNATYNKFFFVDLDLTTEGILAEVTCLGNISENADIVCGVIYSNEDFDSPPTPIQTDVFKSEQPISVYAQLDVAVSESVNIVGGLQYNKPVDAEDDISPRIALINTFNENWSLKIMHGEAFRSPNFLENYISSPGIISGNPDLDPETVTTSEIQLNYSGEQFNGSITYFYSEVRDLITRVGFPIVYENGGPYGDVEFDGIELEGKLQLGHNFVLHGNATYQTNETEFGLEQSSFTPEVMAKVGISYASDRGILVGIYDSYFGDPTDSQDVVPTLVSFIPEFNPEPEPYHLVTFNATFDLTQLMSLGGDKTISLNIFIDNLLDDDIHFPDLNSQHVNSYPLHSPRAYYVTLGVEF